MSKYSGFIKLGFNPASPTILHIDLNSCFATIEQQANPNLRGKPIAVCAYTTPAGCILAPSVEAKRCGVKTGMRVRDGKALCPGLLILPSDPWKYRNVHLLLRNIIKSYTWDYSPKSIDEFVLNLEGFPCLRNRSVVEVAREIKQRIKKEAGEWLTVSIGISTNRFLAKLAAGFNKPDGLDIIDVNNYRESYRNINLTDLPWIKERNALRLNGVGIYSVWDFYNADIYKLKYAFNSVIGYYWYLRLKGWEIDEVDFGRKSFGNSYSLPKPLTTAEELSPVLYNLVEKMSMRLRRQNYKAGGVHLSVSYRDHTYWHKGALSGQDLFDTRDIYKRVFWLLKRFSPRKPVAVLFVSCFSLSKLKNLQLSFFENIPRKLAVTKAVDKVNNRWGEFVVMAGKVFKLKKLVPDRVAYGNIKEIEEFMIGLK